jgi:hypothetical protein
MQAPGLNIFGSKLKAVTDDYLGGRCKRAELN